MIFRSPRRPKLTIAASEVLEQAIPKITPSQDDPGTAVERSLVSTGMAVAETARKAERTAKGRVLNCILKFGGLKYNLK